MVKVEYGESFPLHAAEVTELHFLRTQVRELQREKAELLAENDRLNNMLIHGESHGHSRPIKMLDQFQRFLFTHQTLRHGNR